ncbi:hypothetical protein DXG01_012762 [Tephrocybe rancida]|nr:hypothetical protein DXG01_012762 [Tephrocybe rancida]
MTDRKTSSEPASSENTRSKTGPSKEDEKAEDLDLPTQLQFDLGKQVVRFRSRWWQVWIPRDPPPPPRATLSDAPIIPLLGASIFSQLTYTWVTPIMTLGYQRTLQATDLWKVDPAREAGPLSAKLDAAWDRRTAEAAAWNTKLERGEIKPSFLKRSRWAIQALAHGRHFSEKLALYESEWREKDGRKEPSLAWALNDTLGFYFWTAGAFKTIINFAKARALAKENGMEAPHVGRGIGMAIGLFSIVITASLTQHQFFWRAMSTGVLARAALVNSIYKRGVRLTAKARITSSNSNLINHISTDVSRIDACAQWFHAGWTAPIQVTICLIILLVQLGPSALAGFALFLCVAPIQERVMAYVFKIRRASMKFSDQRAKTLLEVLGLATSYAIAAFAYSIPVLAATLSFVTYTSTTAGFDIAIIFSSFSLFQPMMFLPRALSATADARNALVRLTPLFHAKLMDDVAFKVDPAQGYALVATNATFEWEAFASQPTEKHVEPDTTAPFVVRDINMLVPRGSLVAIVGRVGSGKSSLLQGLIGEMRRVSGKFSFGGQVAYCPQSAWIQNASLRDNILFGQPYDEERYWHVIEGACLLPDLHVLPDADLTEIGEKGINLSGGQKQRTLIPIIVDAHVGKALFHGAILESLRKRGKTVILVTHALHFLSHCDYIYTMDDGRIAEHGTYEHLVSMNGEFARLDKEFGGKDASTSSEAETPVSATDISEELKIKSAKTSRGIAGDKLAGRLVVKEIRTTGLVSWNVYWTYFAAGRGYITLPSLVLVILLMQGSQAMNSYTLVWWQANTFQHSFSFYQVLYACLGLSQAIFTFGLGVVVDVISWYVSRNLHHNAIRNIFHAKMSFFDTTPMGRILGVFGKDIDNIDNQLPVSMKLLIITLAQVLGSVIIITVVEPYFTLGISLGYQYFAAFYRASAREVKRLDSMLRSVLYAHFSESLTGLPTIRSYGELGRFIKDNTYYIDLENRALLLTVTNQRWLAVRLDFCGACLVFSIAMLTVTGASGISPAQVGLVLIYTTSRNFVEWLPGRQQKSSQDDHIDQEAPYDIPEKTPPPQWPQSGVVEFKDVEMSYRPGLPKVLRGLSFQIRGGEKIGVVGRTGAGKSSLALTLLRLVEYSGSIIVDGIDIAELGLKDLRSKISIIPQDQSAGTVRTALDPFSMYDDSRLWDALRRSFLVELRPSTPSTVESEAPPDRIHLDSNIEAEGANLSVGERSLLSLARALVKDSRVVVLDEATASVDLETDKKIQTTIQSSFSDRTLICIAHRLRTIIHYDRILVLDAGTIAEFDTPSNLFKRADGFFRGLCEKSNITWEEITSDLPLE